MSLLLLIFILVVLPALYRVYSKRKRKQRQCAYGDSTALEILKTPNDYQPLKNAFSNIESPAERYFYSVSISRNMSLKALEKWVEDDPESADALLCYGSRLLQWSWEARGYGRGKSVSKKSWQKFYDRLEKTRSVLLKCAEKDNADPTPWSYLIMVATWHSEDEFKYEYFDQAIKRDPENWSAHMHMITALSEKWGGSHEEMFSFARNASRNASEGSDLASIVVKANLEYWKYLDLFEGKTKLAQEFIQRNDVREEVISAYERSLKHSSFKNSMVSVFARYNLSGWFWLTRDKPRLTDELGILENSIEDIHWRWVGTEGELDKAFKFTGKRGSTIPC